MTDVPSIPELRQGLERRLLDAQWRLAVESHRWVREYDQFIADYGEALTWKFMVDCQVAYWVVSRGRTLPAPGWGDGAQLAHRDTLAWAVGFALFMSCCWSYGYLTAHVYRVGEGCPGDVCVCGAETAGEEW
jgi:hypothetical protein